MNKEEMIVMMREMFETIGNRFIDGLKTDTYKAALETVDNVNEMSDSEFSDLAANRISFLDEEEYREALKVIQRTIENWDEDETFSVREMILLNIQGMIRSHEFRNKHREELNKVNVKDKKITRNGEPVELLPSEILLLDHLDGNTVDLSLPGYFTHEYGIDYQSSLERMIGAGYITFADVEYTLRKCSVQELKELLKNNQLKATGKKDELVSRICSDLPKECLASYEKRYFSLTGKGKTFLLENSHVKYFHTMKNQVQISIKEADEYKKHHITASNREIAFALLDERLIKARSEKNWSNLRNTYYSKSVVCFFEKNYRQELEYLIDVCYMDEKLSERYKLSDPNFPAFASGIICDIQRILREEQINAEEFKQIFQRSIELFFNENANCDMPFFKQNAEEIFQEISAVLDL